MKKNKAKGKTDVFCNAWCGLCDLQEVLSTELKVRIAARITSCQYRFQGTVMQHNESVYGCESQMSVMNINRCTLLCVGDVYSLL